MQNVYKNLMKQYIYLYVMFVCMRLATCHWFSLGTLVSSTNKADRHDKTEILLKEALNTITPIWQVKRSIKL